MNFWDGFWRGVFNKPEHHGFLFLAMELLLLLQILPEVNEQRLVRMSRREHWRKTWAAMGISAFAFSTLFSLIQFFMTLIFIDPTVMLRSGFAAVSVLFFIRIFCVYMVENGVFGVLYVILLRKEVAAVLCTVFFHGHFLLGVRKAELGKWRGDMADAESDERSSGLQRVLFGRRTGPVRVWPGDGQASFVDGTAVPGISVDF